MRGRLDQNVADGLGPAFSGITLGYALSSCLTHAPSQIRIADQLISILCELNAVPIHEPCFAMSDDVWQSAYIRREDRDAHRHILDCL